MSIEAMKKALEALEEIHPGNMTPMAEEAWNKAITALRTAIEQAEEQAEPFGHFQYDVKLDAWVKSKTNNGVAFYTTPPTAQSQDIKSGIETVAAKGGLLLTRESVAELIIKEKNK